MSFDEFLTIYIEATDDARILIEETLGSFEIQSACLAEDSGISHIVQSLL